MSNVSSKAVKRRTDDCGIEACKSVNACKPDNKKRVTPAMNFKGLKFADKHQVDKWAVVQDIFFW